MNEAKVYQLLLVTNEIVKTAIIHNLDDIPNRSEPVYWILISYSVTCRCIIATNKKSEIEWKREKPVASLATKLL
jgi:hypothetical protein